MYIKAFKNSLLQCYYCRECGRVWDYSGDEVIDWYVKSKMMYSKLTLNITCPMCENMNKFEKKGEYYENV